MASDAVKPVLVLGVGNILLRDEGLGVRAVEAMAQMDLDAHVELVDGATAGAGLIDVIADRRKVVVLDAIDAGCPPGTILRMDISDLAVAGDAAVSLHEVGLSEAFAMARRLGCEPEVATVIAMQPGQISPGLELSPPVEAALPTMIAQAMVEISS